MAGVASVMCSYNKINGTYSCENPHTLQDILKGEFGFQGYVVSDWGATHSTGSANAGLDIDMPAEDPFFGSTLLQAVENGTVPESRLDDMVERMLSGWYFLGQDTPDYPKFTLPGFLDTDVQDDHWKIVREIGVASTILLKNTNGTLPLKKPRRIVAIGESSFPLGALIDNEGIARLRRGAGA